MLKEENSDSVIKPPPSNSQRQIALLAVLVAVVVIVLSNQIIFFTERYLPNILKLSEASPLWVPIDIVHAAGLFGFYFGAPVIGFWLARKWPGNHLFAYILLGLVVGSFVLPTSLGLETLFYPDYVDTIDWLWAVSVLLIMPAAMFVSGGLLGDLAEIGVTGRVSWRAPIETVKKVSAKILNDRGLLLKALGVIVSAIVGVAAESVLASFFN